MFNSVRHFFFPHHTNNHRAKLLHPTSVFVISAFLVAFQFFLNQTSTYFPQILGYASQIPPEEVVRLTNIERAKYNLPQLKIDTKLSQAAAAKATDMFAADYWAHVSPTGTEPWSFITHAGYGYRYAGENLARDFADPNSVVTAWMNSTTHRENLLSNRYQDIGVAVLDGNLNGKDTTLVVQMFGTKLSAVSKPTVDSAGPAVVKSAAASSVEVPNVVTQSEPTPMVSTFTLTKAVSVGIVAIILTVLFADVIIVYRKSIPRWTSKSFAHFIFMGVLIIAVITIVRGQIV